MNHDLPIWGSSQEEDEFFREVAWRVADVAAMMERNPLLAYLAQLGDA
jgi:hypothetical protein